LKSHHNFNQTTKIITNADICIYTEFDKESETYKLIFNTNENSNLIILKCKIIDEINEKKYNHKIKENECFITELTQFICYYIWLDKPLETLTIIGSHHSSIEIKEAVKYNTFFKQNKIKKYLIGEINNIKNDVYDIKIGKDIIINCPHSYIDIIDKMKYFKDKKIHTKFVM
jgi:hypothetical protein